ncbi:MerR family transcriptional regulator [Nocardioides sp.]|uniref:MerR family transcriptional regulator n=1 Tax=Nocardioides sp. TaxID=35761 RepID=UPI00271A8C14|nr:MerR family transcriptional regulator [Nocardioides sp.]MDO9454907.1 MerR family transcriptional regulator [Nocardioides sp.]
MDLTIGAVARRTGLTERTLRYYEELGLLDPARDAAGRRLYDGHTLDRLYRIRLLRELGTPVADVDPDASDLAALTRRHLADLDTRLGELVRQRERVRAVEDRLLGGTPPGDEALLDLLSGLAGDELAPTRRIALLVCRDVAAAHAWLVEVFGFGAGPLTYADDCGGAVHGELHVGDGVVWLHRETPEHRLLSPLATDGNLTASFAVLVDDVDAHHERVAAAGTVIDYPPVDQPYGVREYSARDPEGHLWSFHTPIPDPQEQ